MAAPSTASAQSSSGGICDRTKEVRDAIVRKVNDSDKDNCADITSEDLAAITGDLFLQNNIKTLSAGDFAGLENLEKMWVIRNYNLTTLPANVFTGLVNLKVLRVQSNFQLATLPANAFAGLAKLEELHLTDNLLTTVPENLFAGLAELKELTIQRMRFLSHSGLTTIPANAFAGLAKLKKLDLGGNQITTLPANVFSGLGELKQLQLWGTHLATIPANAFANLPNLTELFLSNNSMLTTLPANVFAGLGKLSHLDLSRNTALTTLSAGAFNGLSPGALKINGLVLPAPPGEVRLTPLNGEMRAEWNAVSGARYQVRWKEVSAAAFAPEDAAATGDDNYTITGLQNGGTYEVRVASVPSMPRTTRDLTTWGFASAQRIVQGICGRTEAVRDAILAKVAGKTDCGDILAADLAGITELAVSGAGVTSLSAGDFAGLANLTELQITGTEIPSLPANIFAGLAKLKNLDLSNNLLTALPENLFAGLSKLKKLNLSGNKIASVRASDFADLSVLRELHLNGNGLANLPANVFARLVKLEKLMLASNRLTTLPANGLANLVELREADLSDNALASLPGNLFAGLKKLRVLRLKGNANLQLQPGVFNGMENLRDLLLPEIRIPAGITGLRVEARDTELHAQWNGVEKANYLLRWKPETAAAHALTDFAAVPATGASTLTYEITGLNNGTTYEVSVYAVPDRIEAPAAPGTPGFYSLSTLQSLFGPGTPTTQPDLPQSLAAHPHESGSLRVNWRAPVISPGRARATGYRVRWKLAAAPAFAPADLAEVPADTLSHVIPNLTNDATYEVQVAAKNSSGYGGYARVQGVPRVGICDRPRQVYQRILRGLADVEYCGAATQSDLSAVTGDMELSGDEITSLSADDFAGLANLQKLVIRNTKLTALPARAFAGLTNLQELNLTDNYSLTNFPAEVFAGLGELKKLTLYTFIGSPTLPANPFAGMGKLENLVMHGHRLGQFGRIPANVFADLGALKTLNLERIQTANLPANMFANLSNLTDLGLRSNSALKTLSPGVFNGLSPGALRVYGLALPASPGNIAAEPVHDELRVAWDAVTDAHYQLRWKDVSAAAFASEDAASVAGGGTNYTITGLQTGATYEVRIASVPSKAKAASTAAWGFASKQVIMRGVCDRTPLVRDEIVRQAEVGCGDVTAGHLRAITEMNLAFAPIAALAENDFAGMDNLRILRLNATNPKLTALPENVFAGLSKLRQLHLQGNRLSSLPAGVFAGLSELRELYLQSNQLTALPENVFSDLANLRTLDLEHNNLTALPPGIFSALIPGQFRVIGMHTSPAPNNFRLTASDGRLRAEWDAVPGAHYQLRWKLRTAATFAPEDSVVPDDTNHTLTGLANGDYYVFRVISVPKMPVAAAAASAVLWPYGEVSGAAFLPPNMPGDLAADARESRQLAVSWSAPAVGGGRSPAEGYRVRWKELSAADFADADVGEVAAPELRYDIPGLADGTTYEVQIAATSIAGDSGYTGSVRGVPLTGICERTPAVYRKIIEKVPGKDHCSQITGADLANVSGKLILTGRSISALTEDAFAGLKNVEELYLDQNTLASLPENVFAGLASLKQLHLHRNLLSNLPEDIFADLVNLEELYLNNNRFTAVPVNAVAGLAKLKELHLQLNQIASVPANAFANLSGLETLVLDHNSFSTLPANAFAGLANLTTLNLAGNTNLGSLGAGVFNGLSLDKLAVSGIQLPAAPSALRLTPGKDRLRAEWNAAAALPVHYQLHWKPVAAATFAPADRVTVAAPGLAHDITGLAASTEYEVRITALPNRVEPASAAGRWSFTTARATTAGAPSAPLNLSVRALVSQQLKVSWTAPANDGGSPISGYRVRWKTVSAADFADADAADVDAPALEYDVTGLVDDTAYVVEVAAKNFAGTGDYTGTQGIPKTGICDRTRQVYEEVMQLKSRAGCSQVTAADLAEITSLNLASKSIAALTENAFAGMTELQTLQLQFNALTALPANVFSGLDELLTVDLRSNQLAALPAGVFAGTPKLQTLTMRNNAISALPANVFARLTNLKTLNASALLLTTLPANVFADLARLEALHLSENQIASLPVNAFAGLGSLTTLSLQNNPIVNNRADALAPGVFNGLTPGGLTVNGLTLRAPPRAVRLTPRDRALNVEWDEVAGAHYHVFWKQVDAAAFASADTAVVSSASHTITGLTNGARYEVRVAPVPASAVSGASSVWRHTATQGAPYPPPGAPQNLRASLVNAGELVVAWDAPASDGGTPVTKYHLRREGGGSSPRTHIVNAPALTITLTGLTDGAEYELKVAAETIAGMGAYTPTIRATPLIGVCDRTPQVRDEILAQSGAAGCAAVTAAHLRAITRMEFRNQNILSLTANAFAGMTGMHTLFLRENPRLTALPANVFAGAPNLQLLSLSENAIAALPAKVFSGLGKLKSLWLHGNALTTLPVDVFAGNKLTTLTLQGNPLTSFPVGAFNGLTPDATEVGGFVHPAPPRQVRAASAGVGQVRAEWDAVAGAHYQVRWKPFGTAGFARGDAVATSGLNYTITGLAAGATYDVRVASVPGTPTTAGVASFAVWQLVRRARHSAGRAGRAAVGAGARGKPARTFGLVGRPGRRRRQSGRHLPPALESGRGRSLCAGRPRRGGCGHARLHHYRPRPRRRIRSANRRRKRRGRRRIRRGGARRCVRPAGRAGQCANRRHRPPAVECQLAGAGRRRRRAGNFLPLALEAARRGRPCAGRPRHRGRGRARVHHHRTGGRHHLPGADRLAKRGRHERIRGRGSGHGVPAPARAARIARAVH